MDFIIDLFKSTFKGAVWFITVFATGVLMYADQKHFNSDALARFSTIESKQEKQQTHDDLILEKLEAINASIGELKGELRRIK